jgi:hypothetical protein
VYTWASWGRHTAAAIEGAVGVHMIFQAKLEKDFFFKKNNRVSGRLYFLEEETSQPLHQLGHLISFCIT